MVSPARRMDEGDLVRRLAPRGALDERDHAVEERLPGLLGDLDHDRSESTRVPPVTALRSPPDSRMTGADSPVIADSSTEAMPSITVPSPGMSSPASTTTTSPRTSSDARFASRRPAAPWSPAHRAQRRRLGAAAALGDGLGEVAEQHGEPQPDATVKANQPGWPGSPAIHRTVVNTAPSSTTNMTGLRAIARGSSLRGAPSRAGGRMAGSNSERSGGRSSGGLPVEREVELQHVDRPLAGQPGSGRAAWSSTARARGRGRGRARAATRLAWMRALASEMCGSTPEAEVVAASAGTRAAVRPGVNGRSRSR